MNFSLRNYIVQPVHIAPLVVFRILFGAVMFISLLRFWVNGWIGSLYIEPVFHFSYYGFGFVKPVGNYTYLIFAVCALASLMVMLGYRYRLAIAVFFLSFTYIELMDKAYYLNHYYFISLAAFLLIWLPAANFCSLDVKLGRTKMYTLAPRYSVGSLRLLMCMVYFFAGLAKLNSDWLLEALPLKIWLPSRYDVPLIGQWLSTVWAAYLFSWCGAMYDLFIWVFLLIRKTRPWAFVFVVIFHLLTAILFPAIGMFPYIMLLGSLVFYSEDFHLKLIRFFSPKTPLPKQENILQPRFRQFKLTLLAIFFLVQMLFPLRYLLYPGELFWTEEGYRFSWRVMLVEKTGMVTFVVKDAGTGKTWHINNSEHLSAAQEKQMSFQPDMILQFAHYLGDLYKMKGVDKPQVFAQTYVVLNARPGKPIVDPQADLYREKDSFLHKKWITSLDDDIKGF